MERFRVMTSHFGIVVTDSNKRGENEALNDEEKRQMWVAAGGRSRGSRHLKLSADALTLKRGFCSMPAKLAPLYRYLHHASQIQPIIFVQAAPPISAHALESLFAGMTRISNLHL
jgi:hypothetical protein